MMARLVIEVCESELGSPPAEGDGVSLWDPIDVNLLDRTIPFGNLRFMNFSKAFGPANVSRRVR